LTCQEGSGISVVAMMFGEVTEGLAGDLPDDWAVGAEVRFGILCPLIRRLSSENDIALSNTRLLFARLVVLIQPWNGASDDVPAGTFDERVDGSMEDRLTESSVSFSRELGLELILGGEVCLGCVVVYWLVIARLSSNIDGTDTADPVGKDGDWELFATVICGEGEKSRVAQLDVDRSFPGTVVERISLRLLWVEEPFLLRPRVVPASLPSSLDGSGSWLASAWSVPTTDLDEGVVETTARGIPETESEVRMLIAGLSSINDVEKGVAETTVEGISETESEVRMLDKGSSENVRIDLEAVEAFWVLYVVGPISTGNTRVWTSDAVGIWYSSRTEGLSKDEWIRDSDTASVFLDPEGCFVEDSRTKVLELCDTTIVASFCVVAGPAGDILLANSWSPSQPFG
jgi:hypothetical protein